MCKVKICKYCRKKFEILNRTREYVKQAKFCSQKCYHSSKDSLKGKFKKGRVLKGKKAPNWKGGLIEMNNGYLARRVDGEYKLEHRCVMSEHIGRELDPEEHVHHIDGNKTNNDISNLMLFPSNSAHLKFHWEYTDSFKGRGTS